MVGEQFKQALLKATGTSWAQWTVQLQRSIDPSWSQAQIQSYIADQYYVSGEWAAWLAVMYGQLLGRIPVGVTKDAGVQIGVRRTMALDQDQLWQWLTSPAGWPLWIGNVPRVEWRKGFEFSSEEGIVGKITVVKPGVKLRLNWQLPEWVRPSRLQISLLTARSGKTTVAIHQEMLEDVYVRELMRRHWEEKLDLIELRFGVNGRSG